MNLFFHGNPGRVNGMGIRLFGVEQEGRVSIFMNLGGVLIFLFLTSHRFLCEGRTISGGCLNLCALQ